MIRPGVDVKLFIPNFLDFHSTCQNGPDQPKFEAKPAKIKVRPAKMRSADKNIESLLGLGCRTNHFGSKGIEKFMESKHLSKQKSCFAGVHSELVWKHDANQVATNGSGKASD